MSGTWPTDILAYVLGGIGAGCFITILLGGVTMLVGNMLKLRAQYIPKVLSPMYNKGVMPGGSIATSYWGLLRRAYRLEGTPGLLRGIVPILLPTFVFAHFKHLRSKFDFSLPAELISVTLLSILSCPTQVLVTRTLTTPGLIPFFDIHRMLDTLLTPEERARPWVLYLIPGLLPVVLIQMVWSKLIIFRLQKIIIPFFADLDLGYHINTPALLQLGFLLLEMVVLLPLETLVVRLAQMDVGSMATSTIGEQVLSSRTGQPPYTGAWSCVMSIINEEGFGALYRAWWLLPLVWLPCLVKLTRNAPVSPGTQAMRPLEGGKGKKKCLGVDKGEWDADAKGCGKDLETGGLSF